MENYKTIDEKVTFKDVCRDIKKMPISEKIIWGTALAGITALEYAAGYAGGSMFNVNPYITGAGFTALMTGMLYSDIKENTTK